MKTHSQHGSNVGKHKCNICDEIYQSAISLAEHKLTHCKVRGPIDFGRKRIQIERVGLNEFCFFSSRSGRHRHRVQPLQDDHRQRRAILPTPPEALQPGDRQRRPSDVSDVVHHLQTDAGLGRRGQGARALSSVPVQGTAGRVRQLQPVQIVADVAVRRLQQPRGRGTLSRLRHDVRRFRLAAAPSDRRAPETVPLFQMQGKSCCNDRIMQTFFGNRTRKIAADVKHGTECGWMECRDSGAET